MNTENPIPTPREEQVRAIGPDDPMHRVAVQATAVIKESLEAQSGSVGFSFVVNGEPFCEVRPAMGGRAGINVSFAFLEKDEDGKVRYHEVPLRLKYSLDPLKGGIEWADFLDALAEPERRVEIRCSFDAEPGERVPIILEDNKGRIVVNKTDITGLRYLDGE